MPNKKTKKIRISDLKCYEAIHDELSNLPEYRDYAISDGILYLKEYVPPVIKDVDKAVENIKFCYATKKYRFEVLPNGKELIGQKILAKMAGVSRQTIARWENLGFISRSYVGFSDEYYFQAKEVIAQLEKLKSSK